MALAIANTPFDMPINYAKSGRAIYTWEVMQAYLPCDIEPFYIEPEEYDSRDDWHCPPGVWLGGMDPFMHWRRSYMLWSTEEDKRQDEENRHKHNMQASKDLIAALAELSKKSKTSKKSSKKSRCPVKSKIRTVTSKKSRCPIRLQMQHTKEEEEDILRLIDEDRGERTPSSSHSWMHEDVQDLDEATQSSPHSWMHEEDAAPKLALRSLETSATPSSPHSWMHDEVASPEPL